MAKVALVTGANKGIGFAIVRGLCKQFSGDVYLLARDVGRGEAAVAELQKEGLQPKFHQLDITDRQSCETLASFIKSTYGGIDILVNNAGIAYKGASTAPFSEQAEVSVACNYFGTLNVCDALFPLLRAGARVVHVASGTGVFGLKKSSKDIRDKFINAQSIDEVSKCMNDFVSAVKAETYQSLGWPQTAYGVSKAGGLAITPIQQRQFDQDSTRPDIVINAICPGYVSTDMTSHKGTLSIDQGAETPLYCALLPPNTDIRGQFLRDKTSQPWY